MDQGQRPLLHECDVKWSVSWTYTFIRLRKLLLFLVRWLFLGAGVEFFHMLFLLLE